MASHTGFGGGNPCKGAYFNSRVAVATVNSHASNMVFMAEVNRLINCYIDLIDKVYTVDIEEDT